MANVSTAFYPTVPAEDRTDILLSVSKDHIQASVLPYGRDAPLLCIAEMRGFGQAAWQETGWENTGSSFSRASHSRWDEHFNKSSEQMS